MLAGSSKGFQYTSALRYRLGAGIDDPDPFESTLVDSYEGRKYHLAPSEIVLESKICQEWKLGRCNKGEKCRFRHKVSSQEQYNHILPGATLSRNLKEEDGDDVIKVSVDDSDGDSSDNDGTGSEDEDSDVDEREGEKDSQNEASRLFPGVLMTVLVLEQIRRLVFKGVQRKYGDEEMEKEMVDTQKRCEMFDGLGNRRREELATVRHQESRFNGEPKREGPKRWIEEGTENQKNDINKMPEELGRQKRERRLSTFEAEGNLEGGTGKETLRGNQIDQETLDFMPMSTISRYIVLESNLVTCGAGLDIHRITPGYDLCQISLKLPIETTGTEIVEMFLEEGLETSDFHVLRIEETGEQREATILINIHFGNALERKEEVFSNRKIGFEVRRDAVWTSGTMGPGNMPSLVLTWNSEDWGSSLSEEISNIALAAVYDSLFELDGARMETCCLLTPDSESTVNQVTLTVEFDNWDNAIQAARDIQSKRPNIPSFQVKTTNAHERSVVIPLLQYEAQKRQWLDLSDTDSEEGRVEIEITDDQVIIRVQGENNALVGALKVRLEKLVRGDVLDGAYWHPSFASSEESASFFSEVMQIIYLKCCLDTHTLALYGESSNIEKARKMIQAEVDRREQVMTKTTLTGPSISFFKNGGIQKLKDLVGEEEVNLKSTSRWSAVMMRGGETATHHLRRLIKESLVEVEEMLVQDSTTTCPVCLEEQLNPEMLECGHGYCSGCLDLFLKAATENQEFPIVCVGNSATCNVPIALPFIHRFLPPHSFKKLVEAAFVAYLQRNPTQFRYCKTPDCRQTYRQQLEDEATIITCPSCFAKTCSACSEDHANMNCAEYRIYNDPEAQERLNNELADTSGYKRCPRCAVWVEKMGGCNHMNCKCGAHICWICLGIFDPEVIYDHISTHATAIW